MGGRVAQRCGCVHRVRACCASVLACGHTLRWRPARSTWHEHAQTASFTFKLACVVFLGGFLCATEFPDGLLEQTMQVSLWLQRGAIALLLMRGAMRAFQAMRAFVAPGTVATGARNRGNSTVRRLFAPELGVYETLFPRHSDLLSVALLAVLLLDRAIIGVMIHHLRGSFTRPNDTFGVGVAARHLAQAVKHRPPEACVNLSEDDDETCAIAGYRIVYTHAARILFQLWAPVIPVLFGAAFVRRRHREQREQRRLLPSMDAYGDSDTESDSDDEGAGPDPGAPGSLAPPPVGRDPKLDAELGDDTFDSRGPLPGLGILRSYFLITLAEGWLAYLLSRVDKSGHPSLAHNHITFQWRALSAVVFDWFGAWSTMHPLWWLALCFAATGVRAVSSMVRTEYVRRTQGAFTWTLPGWVRHPVVVIVGISAAAHSIFWGGFTASALHRLSFVALVRLTAEHVTVQNELVQQMCHKLRLNACNPDYKPAHRVHDYLTQLGVAEARLVSDVRQVWVIAAAHAALNAFLDWQDLTPWGLTAEQMLLLVARHIAHSVLLLYMYFFVHRVINRYHDTLLSTWKEMRYLHARLPASTLTKEECDDWILYLSTSERQSTGLTTKVSLLSTLPGLVVAISALQSMDPRQPWFTNLADLMKRLGMAPVFKL